MHAPPASEPPHRWPRRWPALAAFISVAAFAVLVGRFWHPYYGFTSWLQMDEFDAAVAVRELRAQPVFVYRGESGYDGAAYVQIAIHPALDSPDLTTAISNVPYRARRILASALAWLVGRPNPAHIANVYAGLNVAVWLALAFLLWRILPVTDARGWIAWAGVMFSAGALHSVRLALPDLSGAALVTAALALSERGRSRAGAAALALSGLARETALMAVAGLWRGPWTTARPWLTNAIRTIAVALPLLAWMAYIRWRVGPADQGFGNLTFPGVGWWQKWHEVYRVFAHEPHFRWLNTTTLLALIALTVQAAWLLRRLRPDDAWWRAGIAGVGLMVMLGTAVWEGQPGAATRVLLPMSVAFAVLTVRAGAGLIWIAGGSLTVFSGVLALWHVPHDATEFGAGRIKGGGYVVQIADGWSGVEQGRGRTWAWAQSRGELVIQTTALPVTEVAVRLQMRAITPREVEIRDADVVRWRGDVGARLQPITTVVPLPPDRRIRLTFSCDAPPVTESSGADARQLGFAVYDVRLE